jgi:large subunit ribosomal protein L10
MKREYKIDPNRKAIREKAEQIERLKREVANYSTIALIDIQKVPNALLQRLRKRIKEEGGAMYILRKPVIKALLEANAALAKFSHLTDRPVGLLLANSSPYELNKRVRESRRKRAAKAGEKALSDIIVPEGETDLPPGPALSELKSAGVNVQIKGGKIVVVKDSVVVKKDEVITAAKAGVLQKLGILPFESTVNLLVCYDGQYVYTPELLNIDLTLSSEIEKALRDAFNLSINANYPTPENINLLIQQAYIQSINLSLNGNLYSSSTIEQLLLSAVTQAMALECLEKK